MASAPFAYGKPVGYAGVDPAVTQPGRLPGGQPDGGRRAETFFIASQDIPAPIQVVLCNQVLTDHPPDR